MTGALLRGRGIVLLAVLGMMIVGCRGQFVLDFDFGDDGGPPDAGIDAVVPECTTPADCPDDTNSCTEAPDCVDGFCTYVASAVGTACSDGVYCNGEDTCDGFGTCEHAGDPCLSGTQCSSTCDEANDTCDAPVGSPCDDALYCNGEDTCDGAGVCNSAGDPCAAGDGCNNTCDETTDTCFSPAATVCDDGVYCNGVDTCDGAGVCNSAGDPCAAGDACNNTCNEATGDCFSPVAAACDNGLFCDGVDTCDGTGTCNSAGSPCSGLCDEVNDNCPACGDGIVGAGEQCDPGAPSNQNCCDPASCQWTIVGIVDPQTVCAGAPECQANVCDGGGGCGILNVSDGTLCTDNGQYCDGAETCQAGVCTSPGDPCPAGDACNVCNEATDTCFAPAATACDDGAYCNGADTCDGAGVCVSPGDPCAAGNACTNTCNEATDTCFSPAATACDDGAYCNGVDACDGAGVCVSPGDPCAAGNACNNTCNEATDTCFSPAATACDDGAYCNGVDTCDGAGVCNSPGDPCSAGNVCNNTCNEATDTCFSPAATACDDGAFCNGVDTCDGAGVCVSPGDPCAAGGPCSNSCNEAQDDCFSPNNAPCDDGLFCNGTDRCNNSGGCVQHTGDPCSSGGVCNNTCNEGPDNCLSSPATVCRVPSAGCDPQEQCDGINPICPVDINNCGETICDDVVDNDTDGDTDCDDSDCYTDPICATCLKGDLGNATGTPVLLDGTGGFSDDYPISTNCGPYDTPGEGADVVYLWTPTLGGCYQLDTNGSTHPDPVLRIYESCDGQELHCDDDSGDAGLDAELLLLVTADTPYFIVIDGYGGSEGDFTLNIQRLGDASHPFCACPAQDLGGATGQPVTSGTNVGFGNTYPSSLACGALGTSAEDVTFTWTAPQDGCFQIDTDGSNYDTILRFFATCGSHVELECDEDSGSTASNALIERQFSAGETINIVVDGDAGTDSGNYELNIQRLGDICNESGLCVDGIDNDGDGDTDCADSDCATHPSCCPAQNIGSGLGTPVASGSNVGWADVFPNTTCGGSGGLDVSFGWTAPLDGCYEISTDNSTYDTVLRIFDSCAGAQQDCDDDGGTGSQSLLNVQLNAAESLVIVVDGYSSASTGTYDLNIVRLGDACDETGLCADGIDNDGDGDTDCADSDCTADPLCTETGAECTDSVDNDGDGDVDCADSDCATHASCCPNQDIGNGLGTPVVSGSNVGWADVYPGTTCGGSGGEDVSFGWTAPLDGCYEISTDGSNYDTVLRIFDTCGGAQQDCDDDGGSGTQSLLTRTLSAAESIIIVVDGYSSASSGNYDLNIERIGAACDETGLCVDGLDNDGDGDTDCLDADCAADPACLPPGAACTDAIDVTGGPFPYQEIGTFDLEVDPGGSCDLTPNNMVFFTFTPPATTTYTIDVENFTGTIAYSRLAVFDTTACSPYGAELACVTNTALTASTTVALTAGQSYLIVFYTDGDAYTMVDPEITITP